MHQLLDVLASGVHDTKNQLFCAEAHIAETEKKHGIDLSEARYAIEAAAQRLSRTLTAYHLLRDGASLAVVPTLAEDLCSEIAIDQQKHLARAGIVLEVKCEVRDAWPLDRDLIADVLNNAVQNAGRHARSKIMLHAWNDDTCLHFRVEDDGSGFADLATRGTGLLVAERIARLHQRQGKHGSLTLSNNGTLGGAVFELCLP
ncbi:MAG: sensor histidine kinase [Zoogloeaceae bacterium]|nr:sensor histidine kinase [Zoogloeaceae bacterium]